MKAHFLFGCFIGLFLIMPFRLLGGIATLTVGAAVNLASVGSTSSSNSNQMVIPTNVVAQILHLHVNTAFAQTSGGSSTGNGSLTIQVNGLSFNYTESALNSASNGGNNMPIVVGPAIISISAQASVYNQYAQPGSSQVNVICAISTNQPVQCNTNYSIPNTGVVIPSDATGPVRIDLQSSSDLINWTSCLPGTYGNTYSNRFFRVIAIAQ